MGSALLIILILIDLLLLGAVLFLGKKRINPVEIIEEISEERRNMNELRQNFKEEMSIERSKIKEMHSKLTVLGTEIEQEIKQRDTDVSDGEVVEQILAKVDPPLKKLQKKIVISEKLLKKIEKEKNILKLLLSRAEQLGKFFRKNADYDKILEEIEDRKYGDARSLLAKGMVPKKVAEELGISESEVNLLMTVG